MSSIPRVLGGLVIAPPAAGAIIGLALGLVGLTPAILFAPVIGALFGWPAAIVLGIPAYLLLRRWRLTSWYAYTLAGLLTGLAAAAIAAAAGGLTKNSARMASNSTSFSLPSVATFHEPTICGAVKPNSDQGVESSTTNQT